MSLSQSTAPSWPLVSTMTATTTTISRGRQRRLPTTLAALFAAAVVAVVLSPASASSHDDTAGGLLRGGGSRRRHRETAAITTTFDEGGDGLGTTITTMPHRPDRELGRGGGNDDDKKETRKKRIRDENDRRKDANKKMRDREDDKRKKKKRGKTNKESDSNNNDDGNDDDESKAQKRPKPKNDKKNDLNLNMNLNSDETDDDESKSKADKPEPNSDILEDDDQGESKADKPKPNSEAVEDGNDKPLMGYGPPYDDEKVRLFVLEYLGIDPDQFPYMSKEEREKALKMMDGILNIDLGSGGGDGMTPLLSDVNPTGEDNPPPPSPTDVSPTGDVIVYDPAPPSPTDVSPTGDVIVYDPPPPSPTDGWNLDGSCKEGVEFQLESFEDGDGIIPALNGVTAMRWTTMSIDPWSQSTAKSHDGRWSTRSGITQSARRGAKASTTVYSNITLTTEAMFKGGVLTFKLYAESLGLPREALFVIVDGKVESTIGSGSDMANGQWVEYSVAVGYGAHDVTFSHAYNPFGLESLPQGRTEDGGLWMDDVRYAPFMTSFDMSQVDMINGGCISTGVATPWKVESGGTIVSASSSDIKGSNSADISFTVYTEKGGMLTYSLYTSTTGPHDDFAILLNNGGNEDTVATADFGDMRGFESKSLSVPKGKVTVVLQHRKDPGRLGSDLLGSLGQVVTDGVTRLNDLRFQAN